MPSNTDGRKLSPKRIAELERTAACLELRKRGKTFEEIAEIVGYASRNGPYLIIQRELNRAIREPVEGVLELELRRLDSMLDALWDKAIGLPERELERDMLIKGDLIPAGTLLPAVPADEKAVNAVLKLMERRAKLVGLDKPVEKKVDYTITEIPSPPSDMVDYSTKLLAALQIAGALDMPLPAKLEGLAKEPGLLLEGQYEVLDEEDPEAL